MTLDTQPCRACGADYSLDTPICPVCKVPRKGDVNWPAIRAYGFFLVVMFVVAAVAIRWILTDAAR